MTPLRRLQSAPNQSCGNMKNTDSFPHLTIPGRSFHESGSEQRYPKKIPISLHHSTASRTDRDHFRGTAGSRGAAAGEKYPGGSGHPGHALIARLLTEYYRRVLSGINETEDPGYTVPDLSESQTRCRYRNADLIFSDELTPDTAEGFEAAKVTPILSSDKGWKTTSAGSISFTVTTREIGIAWLQKSTDPDGICADYQLIIDGEPAMTLPGAASSWGPHPEYRSVLLEETASHKIELRPVEGSTGTDFEILALGIVR